MNEKQILEMIDRYLAGEASAGEIKQLDAWLERLDKNPSVITSLSLQELKDIAGKMFATVSKALDSHPDDTTPQT